MFQQSINDLSAAQLLNPVATDKVFAIIELMTNPEKYKKFLETLKKDTVKNTQSLEDLNLGAAVHGVMEEAESLRNSSKELYKQAKQTLDQANQQAKEASSAGDLHATQVRQEANRFADRVKSESKALKLEKEKQVQITQKMTREHKALVEKLVQAEEREQQFKQKLQELKSRFEGL